MLCSVVKHLGSGRALKKWGKNTLLRLVFSPTLLLCSTASCMLYNRTEHSRDFFIILLIRKRCEIMSKTMTGNRTVLQE